MNYEVLRDENVEVKAKKESPNHQTHQTHVHEITGSVKFAQEEENRHNHRFATVSSEVIPLPIGGHKHTFSVHSDFFDHLHDVTGETGNGINVGNGKHVHYATGRTTLDDGHYHNFQFATLIDSPLLPEWNS